MKPLVIMLLIICALSLTQEQTYIRGGAAKAKVSPGKPNILFVVSDDLNTYLGCYGHYVAKTPNIDRLAATSTLFLNAHCQFPLCNPSRTSFLSGLRPETTGVMDNSTSPRIRIGQRLLLPELLSANGYFSAKIGKIEHSPFADGIVKWDYVYQDPSIPDFELVDYGMNLPPWQAIPPEWNIRETDEYFADEAVRFIMDPSSPKPFFLAVGFRSTHRPFVAPKEFFDLYNLDQLTVPPEPEGKFPGITQTQFKEIIRAYLACISYIDSQLGKILDALDKAGSSSQTIVVFTSDHGLSIGEHGRWGQKQTLYEEVARVPLIIRAPGFNGGQVSHALVELVDLYPTISEMCNIELLRDLEGLSLCPLLINPDLLWKKGAFTTNLAGTVPEHSVRTDRFRLIKNDERSEFYDLLTDQVGLIDVSKKKLYKRDLKIVKKILRKGWRAARP